MRHASWATRQAAPAAPPRAGARRGRARPSPGTARRTPSPSARTRASPTASRVTARAFARALERILDPAMESVGAATSRTSSERRRCSTARRRRSAGAVAKGRTLTLRLTKRVPDFLSSTDAAVRRVPEPARRPGGREGAARERGALLRRRSTSRASGSCWSGTASTRASVPTTSTGSSPTSTPTRGDPSTRSRAVVRHRRRRATSASALAELAQRYGVNRSQFFVEPGTRPEHVPFQHEPAAVQEQPEAAAGGQLRRRPPGARRAKRVVSAATPTDQYLLPGSPATGTSASTRSRAPTCAEARTLAKGHMRGGKAVLYMCTCPVDVAQAQILQRNLKAIGLDLEIKQFPSAVLFEKLATPGEPFDIGRVAGSASTRSLSYFNGSSTGGRSGSPDIRQLLVLQLAEVQPAARPRLAAHRGGALPRLRRARRAALARRRARDPVRGLQRLAFVSARVGCVVMNPCLDLTAVCLK